VCAQCPQSGFVVRDGAKNVTGLFSICVVLFWRIVLGIEFSQAVWTKPVAELGIRVLLDIDLDLVPIPLVILDLFAVGTDR
jgi:hypothetical protein